MPAHFRLRVIRCALLLWALPFVLGGAEATRRFDVPAAEANRTLKQFAVQAGREIVFAADDVRGVKTRAVRGALAPKEALDQMLAGTGLVATQEEKTGAFAVRRDAALKKGAATGRG